MSKVGSKDPLGTERALSGSKRKHRDSPKGIVLPIAQTAMSGSETEREGADV